MTISYNDLRINANDAAMGLSRPERLFMAYPIFQLGLVQGNRQSIAQTYII